MSHFSLAIFTPERPSQNDLMDILSPYEETNTNSQSKWDWWMIGGRWARELIVKPGINNFILDEPDPYNENTPKNWVDGARICDLDLDAMQKRSTKVRAEEWDIAFRKQSAGEIAFHWTVDTSKVTREEHISQATPFTPFAYIVDGKWYEKGQMLWFAIVKEEKAQTDWNSQFQKAFQDQPEDHWITVIDCHI